MSDLIFHAGAECYDLYGTLSKRTSLEEDVAETFTRTGTAYYLDRAGRLKLAEANALRTEWADADSLFDTPALLLEAARTNLLLRSEDFSTTWINVRTTEDASAIEDPAGGTDSYKLKDDSTSAATHYIYQPVTKAASSLDYAFAIHVRSADYSKCHLIISDASLANRVEAAFDLTAKTAGTVATAGSGWTAGDSRITELHSSWFRIEITGTSDTDTTVRCNFFMDDGTGDTYDGDGASGMNIFGATLEQATFASSYIQTVGSAVTRNVETLTFPFPFKPQEMTLYCKFIESGSVMQTSSSARIITLGKDDDSDPRLQIRRPGSAGYYAAIYDTGATNKQPDLNGEATPVIEDTVELRLPISSAGLITINQSINGAAEETGSTVTALELPTLWSDTVLHVGGLGGSEVGFTKFLSIKVAREEKTLSEMRALGV